MTTTTTIFFLLLVIISVESIRLIILGLLTKKLAKNTKKASQVARVKVSSVLIVGDSLAYGTGASTPENSLAGRLAKDYKNLTIENRSENGASIKQVIRQLETVGDRKFMMVMIYVGGIDTVSLTRMNKIEHLLQCLYKKAKKVSTGQVIHVSVNNTGLVPMFRFPLNLLFTNRSRKISILSQSLSEKNNIVHIPLYTEIENDPFHGNPRYYAKDKIHPNDSGYEIWYKEISKVIKPYLEKMTLDRNDAARRIYTKN